MSQLRCERAGIGLLFPAATDHIDFNFARPIPCRYLLEERYPHTDAALRTSSGPNEFVVKDCIFAPIEDER